MIGAQKSRDRTSGALDIDQRHVEQAASLNLYDVSCVAHQGGLVL